MQVEKDVIALTAMTQTNTEYTRALHSLPKNAPLQPTHPLSTPTMVEKHPRVVDSSNEDSESDDERTNLDDLSIAQLKKVSFEALDAILS